MGDTSEIEEVTAYRFAGRLYSEREDAERELARQNLYEFIKKEFAGDIEGPDLLKILSNLERNFERYLTLLNAFY